MFFADLPIEKRAAYAWKAIRDHRPDVDERHALLHLALVPPEGLLVPTRPEISREEALVRARELRAEGWSYARISVEVGVSASTLKGWPL